MSRPERKVDQAIQWGTLTQQQFMARHWQRRPLVIRQAFPGFKPLLSPNELFALAQRDEVESRLIQRQGQDDPVWRVDPGPFRRRQIPSIRKPDWTLLVQGVDLHSDAVSSLMRCWRFIGEARLDDLMISYASLGGGVGPHVDNYDVFLLQAHGVREWRIGPVKTPRWRDGAPLKLLRNFKPTEVWELHPGDVLYLPPGYGHDGVALTPDCMTYSIGFRAPTQGELALHLLQRHLDGHESDELAHGVRYTDQGGRPTKTPGRIPDRLQTFGLASVRAMLEDPAAFRLALGEVLTEPKPKVWFEARPQARLAACRLDRRSRMLWDDRHVYVNGEAWRVKGADAQILRRLADQRILSNRDILKASPEVKSVLTEWLRLGWLVASGQTHEGVGD